MAQSKNPRFKRRYRYYEILEASRNATQDEIRRAYLKRAKVYHPDVNPNPEAHEKFKKINEAYEVLSDLTHRASYDTSPAECPVCWTYEVIQTTETQWRCRHCGCKFDPFRVSEVVEQVEAAAIPERLREELGRSKPLSVLGAGSFTLSLSYAHIGDCNLVVFPLTG